MLDPAPLILTLTLDPASQSQFDALRSAHFPAHRLVVGAHLTLFHALPADLNLDMVKQAAASSAPFPVQVTGVRFLGRGVAFALDSEPLRQIRGRLRQQWAEHLTPQDRQTWQPHVTVQNKVDPKVARSLHQALAAGFVPYRVIAMGLALWIYRNGPWEALSTFPFEARPGHTEQD